LRTEEPPGASLPRVSGACRQMAKKPNLDNPLARTEPQAKPAPGPGKARRRRDPNNPVSSVGVGLRASEWQRLQEIAAELGGVGLHPLMQWVLRDFIRRYDAGEARPKTETTVVLKD